MATKVDVAALAKLARIEVSKEEITRLEGEIPEILAFVEVIQKVATAEERDVRGLHNVMRSDENPHESGKYTEVLLKAAPSRKGNRIAVKQVISRAEIFNEQGDYENPSVVSKKATQKKT